MPDYLGGREQGRRSLSKIKFSGVHLYCLCTQATQALFFFFFLISFLGPYLWHTEVSRLRVESGLQLPGCATAIAMQYPRHVCDLHHGSWQCQILNSVREARDQTRILMDTSWVHKPLSHNGNSFIYTLLTTDG